MTYYEEIRPGDLLLFPDGRRRCVVATRTSEFDDAEVWYVDLQCLPGVTHKLLLHSWNNGVAVMPNVFREEEYQDYIIGTLEYLPPTIKGYAP